MTPPNKCNTPPPSCTRAAAQCAAQRRRRLDGGGEEFGTGDGDGGEARSAAARKAAAREVAAATAATAVRATRGRGRWLGRAAAMAAARARAKQEVCKGLLQVGGRRGPHSMLQYLQAVDPCPEPALEALPAHLDHAPSTSTSGTFPLEMLAAISVADGCNASECSSESQGTDPRDLPAKCGQFAPTCPWRSHASQYKLATVEPSLPADSGRLGWAEELCRSPEERPECC